MLVNLAIAIRSKGFRNYKVAQVAGMSEADFSRKLNGRGEFSPVEKRRISELLDADKTWLFVTSARIPRATPTVDAEPVSVRA